MSSHQQETTDDNEELSMAHLVIFRGYLNRMRQLVQQYVDETTNFDEENGAYLGPLLGSQYNMSIANSIIGDVLIYESKRTSYIPTDNDIEQTTSVVTTDLKDLEGTDIEKLEILNSYMSSLIDDFLLMIVKEGYHQVIPGRYLSNIESNLQEAKYNIQYELEELNHDEI